jgi:hypothetical protein
MTSNRGLSISAKALLWDNTASRAIACGVVSTSVPSEVIARSTWEKLLDQFAQELVRGTPFSRWQAQGRRTPLEGVQLAAAYVTRPPACAATQFVELPFREYVDFNLEPDELTELNEAWMSRLKSSFGSGAYRSVPLESLATASACSCRFVLPHIVSYYTESRGMGKSRGTLRMRFYVFDDILSRRPSAVFDATGQGKDDWGDTGPLESAVGAASEDLRRKCREAMGR